MFELENINALKYKTKFNHGENHRTIFLQERCFLIAGDTSNKCEYFHNKTFKEIEKHSQGALGNFGISRGEECLFTLGGCVNTESFFINIWK